jgi:hypothetical protein
MNADMARWIEAAAKEVCIDQSGPCGDCCEQAERFARAFLQAAAADAWKLTPRTGTPEMYGAMIAKRLDDGRVDRHWQAGHDAAPDYLDETPPFRER